jgi:hypothetical protein
MTFIKTAFNSEWKSLGDDNYLHIINIKEIDTELSSLIDESLVTICEGNSDTDIKTIKKRLVALLTPKRGTTLEMGIIAEFFSHLYLTASGFKQEFLFFNLEEGAAKKGFDGYYSRDKETWIFESKSGKITSKNISHHSKINEAYIDLKKKISGDVKNNPWQNAYTHASQIDVESEENIRENLKKLSQDFTNGIHQNINNFNVMPGSTIFLEGTWESIDTASLEPEIKNKTTKYDFKKINIVCINKNSIDLFWDYLES